MVAEKDDHGRLVHCLIVLDQFFQCLVAHPHEGQVLRRFWFCGANFLSGGNGLRQVAPALSIAGVILHGHIEQKVGLSLGLPGQVEQRLQQVNKPITVAVMGCIVNGPGEAREADIGLAGGKGKVALFRKGEVLRTVDEAVAVEELMKEIERL